MNTEGMTRIESAMMLRATADAQKLSQERCARFFVVSTGPTAFAATDAPNERDTILAAFDCGHAFTDSGWTLRGYWADE